MTETSQAQPDENQPAFPRAHKRQRGYDPAEVDEFLERARKTYDGDLTGPDRVTSESVRNMAFALRRSGYAPRYVDAALDRLEDVFFARERRAYLRKHDGDKWRAALKELGHDVQARASRSKGSRFRRRGILASGYRRSQVDAFVDRISDALSGVTSMNPGVVREAVFHSEWRGYDEAQVDAFLDAVVELLLSER